MPVNYKLYKIDDDDKDFDSVSESNQYFNDDFLYIVLKNQ